MNYTGSPQFRHDQGPVTGVLLINLGTPDAPDTPSLRRYLAQFLWDPRVIEVPRPLWWLILHAVILRVRPARSATAYRSIWSGEGSPLLLHTRSQAARLREALAQKFHGAVLVDYGMRYGNPSIADALQRLFDGGARRLVVLPLYPQYSGPTTASSFDAVATDFLVRRWLPDLRFIAQYHDFEPYIQALAASIERHWQRHGRADRLLFSYHGEPRRYLDQGDPYHCQCHKTTRLVAAQLGLGDNEYLTTFQSRFGREPWLQPYTDETLRALPGA